MRHMSFIHSEMSVESVFPDSLSIKDIYIHVVLLAMASVSSV